MVDILMFKGDYCPNCGAPLNGHINVGWKTVNLQDQKAPAIHVEQIDCEKCKHNKIVISFNDAGQQEVIDMINQWMFGKDRPGGGCPTTGGF